MKPWPWVGGRDVAGVCQTAGVGAWEGRLTISRGRTQTLPMLPSRNLKAFYGCEVSVGPMIQVVVRDAQNRPLVPATTGLPLSFSGVGPRR